VPVEVIVSEPALPIALIATSNADCGNRPGPRLWKGPPKLRVIGPLSVLEPEGVTVSVNASWPLSIRWVPVNDSCKSAVALPEPLLPQAARATVAPAAATKPSVRRRVPLR
jgi:hypothetical protein